VASVSSLIAAPVALRLARQNGAAVLAQVVRWVLLLLFGFSLLRLMASHDAHFTCRMHRVCAIWQWAGVQR